MDTTTTGPEAGRPKPKWRKTVIGMLIGGAGGFFATMGTANVVESGVLGDLGPSEMVAILVGWLYCMTALIVLAGLVNPALGARYLNVEDADELREQHRMLACSGLSMVSVGLAMAALAIAEPAGVLAPPVALAAFVILIALATLGGILQMRDMDEMLRNISREATAMAFYLVSVIGGGWEALAHLGYTSRPAALDWISLFGGAVLAAAMIVVVRRGLALPR